MTAKNARLIELCNLPIAGNHGRVMKIIDEFVVLENLRITVSPLVLCYQWVTKSTSKAGTERKL